MKVDYDSEKRLAVVMYGGVSLAIYIGGVAKELLSMVCATAPLRDDSTAGIDDRELTPVEMVYRSIASKNGVLKTRVLIDVISGTSAGGINGIFLAKALAGSLSMDHILKLWVEEGDLAKLLNDKESVKGTGLLPDDPPASLLNGKRMYSKLIEAFDAMDDAAPKAPALRYDAARVDLFVTTTDVRGEVIRLPVSNTVAREHRHRQRFHFTSESPGQNEMDRPDNPLLAFAARCTSAFPFAFEPFTWNDAVSIAGTRKDATPWTDRLMFVGSNYEQRPFVDGGYLDNKPFSYAIDELARRQSFREVERILFYVEPDPEAINENREAVLQKEKPDAVENVTIALTIPGYETIREDLERVVHRNERIAQLRGIEKSVEEMLEKHSRQSKSSLSAEAWLGSNLGDLVKKYGVAYAPYHRLKVDSVVDTLGDVVCSVACVGRPELAQVIHDIMTGWVRAEYSSFDKELKLLLYADIDYRLRKISFVLRRAEYSKQADTAPVRQDLKAAYDELYDLRKSMRQAFDKTVKALREKRFTDQELQSIAELKGQKRKERLGGIVHDTKELAELKEYIEGEQGLGQSLKKISDAALTAAHRPAAISARIAEAWDDFETYDMVIYPIVHRGAIDEAVEVKVVRISPEDIEPRRSKPLAGASLGHFGAFLETNWRRNDILCGRLDAAEVVIRQLVHEPKLADQRVREAHEAIVQEMLVPYLKTRLIDSALPNAVEQAAVKVMDDKKELCEQFKDGSGYDLDLHRADQVRSAGRAGTIVEQILRDWALKARFPFPGLLRWGALALAMLGQVAIPRSVHQTVAAYWGRLLALAFLLMIIAGWLGKSDGVMFTGLKGFAVVVILTAATLAIAAWIGGKRAWLLLKSCASLLMIAAVAAVAWWLRVTPWTEVQKLFENWFSALDRVLIGIAVGMFVMSLLLMPWNWLRGRATRLSRFLRS